MLTSRGWWFLLALLGVLARAFLAGPRGDTLLATLSLTLLLWFLWEWFWFAVGVRDTVRRLHVERELSDERGPVTTLWTGRSVKVRLQLRLHSRLGLSHVIATEFIPFGTEIVEGSVRCDGTVTRDRPLHWQYRLRCVAVGRVRFEGLRLQLADRQGFFHHATFLHLVEAHRVLPPLVDAAGQAPVVKRHNLLPPPGVHRHRRPGSGTELLDLRDYLPGDPPKMIAWKASARRDRLITRELESEVPVRCTLMLDTSNSVRVGGPGQNALGRIVEIAAAVAQAAIGNRDHIGLGLFDEREATSIRPARGSRHLAELMNRLTDAASQAPTADDVPLEALLPVAHALAREVYPDMMRPDKNAFPFWLPWLSPRPAYTLRRPTLADHLYRFLPWFLPAYWLGGLVLLIVAMFVVIQGLSILRLPSLLFFGLVGLAGIGMLLAYLFLPQYAFFPDRRRLYRWRKQLAAVLSVQQGLAPGGLALLLEDDERLAHALQQFLAEHQVPYSPPLYDAMGRYLFAAPGKVDVLAQALLRAVGRGHDNELFVLLVDLLELENLDPLLKAVQVTLARHHRVLVVCPWPVGIEPPNARSGVTSGSQSQLDVPPGLLAEIRQATTARFHRAYQDVRHSFARLGVPVLCAQSGEPARLVLERLDQLRNLGRKR